VRPQAVCREQQGRDADQEQIEGFGDGVRGLGAPGQAGLQRHAGEEKHDAHSDGPPDRGPGQRVSPDRDCVRIHRSPFVRRAPVPESDAAQIVPPLGDGGHEEPH
jgi:hypothetical protein